MTTTKTRLGRLSPQNDAHPQGQHSYRAGQALRRIATNLLEDTSRRNPDVPFAVTFWDGTTTYFGEGSPRFSVKLNSLAAARRVLADGALGFGEAYMDGEIDIDGNLGDLLRLQYMSGINGRALSLGQKVRAAAMTVAHRNTLARVRKNVSHHYDLSHDFYKLWLDESMTYTCAYFRTAEDTLEQAQNNKHEHICRKLRLEPGMSLVDIGCGWGAMMIYAAEHYGVTCTGYTISEEQYRALEQRVAERGLAGRVKVVLRDYRDAANQPERYDRWVSIGMFEQVGRGYIQTFMRGIRAILKPGGLGLLHTIGHMRPKARAPWMTRYIFPGGYLPTLAELTAPMNDLELSVFDVEDLRLHYGETLDHWDRRFCARIDAVRAMYGERFVRMWRLYLNGAASAFRYGGVRLYQLAFCNGRDEGAFRTRDYLYDNTRGAHPRFDNR
jgi:cyclopropane-fatty-acyl-phospholipid synthase